MMVARGRRRRAGLLWNRSFLLTLQFLRGLSDQILFNFEYESSSSRLAPNQSCGGTIDLDGHDLIYLMSPLFLSEPLLCKWELRVPLGKQLKFIFEHFLLISAYEDCLEIFFEIEDVSGSKKYCSYGPPEQEVFAVGPVIDVVIYSQLIRAPNEGIRARLELGDSRCHHHFLNIASGAFFSPNYPQAYPDDQVCSWIIQVPHDFEIRLNCRYKFWIENSPLCQNDVLFISLGGYNDFHDAVRYCGRRGPDVMVSQRSKVTVLFKTNPFYHYTGFRCDFEAISVPEATEIAPTPQPPINPNNCGFCGIAGRSLSPSRIVNGFVPSVNQFPWMVAILSKGDNDTRQQYCGGTLINDRYVLSAAHCFTGRSPEDLFVDLGDHDLTDPLESMALIVDVKQVLIHPLFGSNGITNNNDLAIVKLNQPLNFADQMRPVCLPFETDNVDGQTAVVAGWGKTSSNGESSPVLLAANVKVLSLADCQAAYMGISFITRNMLCAGSLPNQLPTDACGGDSGGPLMWNKRGQWSIIGVVSTGPPSGACADPLLPGIYTHVSSYLPWIKENSQDSACEIVQQSIL